MRTILGTFFCLLLITFATASPAVTPEHIWSKGFGGFGPDVGFGVAVDASGNVIMVGGFENAVDFGGGTLVSAGNFDIVVAKYSASGGHLWSKRFGSTSTDRAFAVGVDPSGNVFVAGFFVGSVDFGGGNLTGGDIFLAKYDPNGGYLWSKQFASTLGSSGYYSPTLAVDSSGNVVMTVGCAGSIDLGGGNLVSAGGFDMFVAKYNSSGGYQWSKRIGGTADDVNGASAVDGFGNVFVTGSFQGTMNVGGADLVSAGDLDVLLAKFDANGGHIWSRRFGSTSSDRGSALAVDASGNVILTGGFVGTVDFGGGNLVSAGGSDIFLAKYTPNGVHQWSERFGSSSDAEWPYAVAVDGSGNVLLTGDFYDNINFGGGTFVTAGANDMFLAKFNANGTQQYSQAFGNTGNDFGRAVAADGSGNAVVVGAFQSYVDFGGGAIQSGGDYDIFMAKYGDKPRIFDFVHYPNDRGLLVHIHFQKSAHDGSGIEPLVTQYQAFRRSASPAGPPFVLAGGIPATGAESYVMDATTDGDSTCAGQHYSFFYVRGLTDTPGVFYDSQIDSGYSVDNLPPGVPTNLTYAAGHLSWDPSSAPDFDHYSVYGNSTNSFGSATFVNNTVTPGMDVPPPLYAYYFVTATDHACNESGAASTGTLTGVGGTPTSYELSISAYPNPFNPETTIRYTLPTKGRITIDVFDARGAHVATLVDAVTPAGAYTKAWNGHDDHGNAVGTGVYFARLTSPAGTRSYKLTLLK